MQARIGRNELTAYVKQVNAQMREVCGIPYLDPRHGIDCGKFLDGGYAHAERSAAAGVSAEQFVADAVRTHRLWDARNTANADEAARANLYKVALAQFVAEERARLGDDSPWKLGADGWAYRQDEDGSTVRLQVVIAKGNFGFGISATDDPIVLTPAAGDRCGRVATPADPDGHPIAFEKKVASDDIGSVIRKYDAMRAEFCAGAAYGSRS